MSKQLYKFCVQNLALMTCVHRYIFTFEYVLSLQTLVGSEDKAVTDIIRHNLVINSIIVGRLNS